MTQTEKVKVGVENLLDLSKVVAGPMAQITKVYYDAAVAAGFTEAQAWEFAMNGLKGTSISM